MSRTVNGSPAERSIVRVVCPCRAVPAPRAVAEGDTCGNAEPRSPVGWVPRPGMVVPPGSPTGGSVPPLPAFGVGVEAGVFFGLMSTVADAVAEFAACDEVAVAVSVKCLAGRFGAASSACNSAFCPAPSPLTVHLDVPDGTQTENLGLSLLGFADRVILAVPPVPLVSQTQIAYPTVVCGSTALTLLSVCTCRHSVAVGGVGVIVGVPVDVGVVVGVAVAIGDLSVPPGWTGALEVLLAGAGCGSVVGAGETDVPGLGWGSGGGLVLELGWLLGNGGADELVVCDWPAVAADCAADRLAPAFVPAWSMRTT